MAGPRVVFYISGHGFGHASRSIEVINALRRRLPGLSVAVRTRAARWLFDLTLIEPVDFADLECDTGVVQTDSLHLDAGETIRRALAFQQQLARRAEQESRLLVDMGAVAVVGDIPPLAFAAAARAGIPAAGFGNFTWDWIYEGYPEAATMAPGLGADIRRAYGDASIALRLPLWGGFECWRCDIIDIPFVARHSTRSPLDVRDRLGVRPGCRMVLASFGGLGLANLDLGRLGELDGYHVVSTDHAMGLQSAGLAGVTLVRDRDMYAMGLRYEDLVRAADAVVTKPGYGIIAECLANDTAMVYTSRGHFIEYDVLVAAIPRFLRCAFIDHDALFAGAWSESLDRVLAQPAPAEHPATNGAEVASDAIARLAGLTA
jgi:UDP:flavonoid glycosyltransferase YjiC (YdhE family)